jgi:rhodanese-related sulfurtransferase
MPELPPPDALEIAPAELHALLEDSGTSALRLVDCREPDEHAICRIEGAELIPLSRFGEEAARRLLGEEDPRPLVVYCHHGMRSLHATAFLRERGRRETWSLSGGIDLWSRQIDPEVPRY